MAVAPNSIDKISVTEYYQSTRVWKDLKLTKLASIEDIKKNYVKNMPVVIATDNRANLRVAYYSSIEDDSVSAISLDTNYKITDSRLKDDAFVVYKIENLRDTIVSDANTNKINLQAIQIMLGDATEGALILNSNLSQIIDMQEIHNDYEKGKFCIIEIDGEKKVAVYDEYYSEENETQCFITALVDFRAKVISYKAINGFSDYDNFKIYKINNYEEFYKNYKPIYDQKVKDREELIKNMEEEKNKPKENTWSIDQVFELK